MIARIISVVNPTAFSFHTPACNDFRHSKFVRRKKHVDEMLRPQIESFGIKTEIFPAVVDTDFGRVGDEITYKDLRLVVERGNIGCYLSHMMLWRLCIEKDCPLLIVEDDASIPGRHGKNIAAALRVYESIPDNGDILYLLGQLPYARVGIHDYPSHIVKPIVDGLLRAFPIYDLAGTAAYAIRPAAAKKLLDRALKVPMIPVDGFIHGAVNAMEIGVAVPTDFKKVFMLHEHFADWNHVHMPSE